MKTATDRETTAARTWGDLTDTERQDWSEDFAAIAEREIAGYDFEADTESTQPWCAPWYEEGFTASVRTPDAYFAEVRSDLEGAIAED